MSNRFIYLLVIIFLAAFLWGGGRSLIPAAAPVADKASSAFSTLSSGWDSLYRLVALKSAVEAKIDKKSYVQLKDIPLSLQQAIIAVEDNRFYRHIGFDIEGIARASLVNLQAGSIAEGGSTITQQLARNLFLNQERSFSRKIEELILAVTLELRYSKDEILELYLNSVYFGSGYYGIGPAAQGYFGKDPSKLNLAESTILAGLPNAPSLISPYVDFSAAKQRQTIVLSTMVKNGYIGPALADETKRTPIRLAK